MAEQAGIASEQGWMPCENERKHCVLTARQRMNMTINVGLSTMILSAYVNNSLFCYPVTPVPLNQPMRLLRAPCSGRIIRELRIGSAFPSTDDLLNYVPHFLYCILPDKKRQVTFQHVDKQPLISRALLYLKCFVI